MKIIQALVPVGLVLSAAACGGGGGGGGAKTPTLASISPEQGSSHTIWTLRGEDFPKKISDIDVWFDGELATVLGVSTGRDAIRVTNAFTPVSEAETKVVEVRVGSKRSGVIAVTAVPDGTIRSFGDGAMIPGPEDTVIAAEGDTVYFGDPLRGVFAYDLVTRVFRLVLRPGIEVRQVTHLAAAGGLLLVADDDPAGGPGVRMWDPATGTLVWADSGTGNVASVGLAADGTAYVSTGASVTQYDPDGAEVPSYAPSLGQGCSGIAVRGADIYCTQNGAGEVVRIDAAGSVTDFTLTSIPGANLVVTDGTNLFVAGDAGLSTVDTAGTVAAFSATGPATSTITALAFAANEPVMMVNATQLQFHLWSYSSPANWRAVGGVLNLVLAIARAGDEYLLADNKSDCAYDADGDPFGLVFAVGPAGGRVVTTEACVFIGLDANQATGEVLFTSAVFGAVAGSVGSLDVETGAVTAVLGTGDLLDVPYTLAIDQANGAVALSMIELPGSTRFGMVSPTGELDASIGDLLPGASISLYTEGGTAFAAPIDLAGGTVGLGVWSMPVTGGTWTEVLPGVTPFSDGFATDGAGGFYVSDLLALGVIWHHRADGTVAPLTVAPGEDLGINTLEYDPVTGELVVAPLSLSLSVTGVGGDRLRIVSP